MKKHPALFGLLALALAACSTAAPQPTATATSSPSETPQPTATGTPVPTSTALRTPPALPGPYQASSLNPNDTPHTYLQDTCQYLRDRWDPAKAAPGTVVMVIMFHSILAPGDVASDPNQMEWGEFQALMNDLHDQSFQAITSGQLADFLETNAAIPSRSVVLIVDDRHYAEYFNLRFRPYHDQWGWPVVNSWISLADSIGAAALPENLALENEGWVDHQAHGVVHNIPIGPDSSDAYILGELQGSIDAFRVNYNKTPIAYIWPGGGFSPHAAALARQVGYKLGFTINPRGPLMYNWVPLSDAADPMRPSYLPEGAVNDPLMVLPRYWDTDARLYIDNVRLIGKEAAAYAQQNRAVELEYYDIVCAPAYGPIPTSVP